MAASATFALKAGVWFRRARLLIVSPDSRVNLARRQAETPLIPLFRFLRPALSGSLAIFAAIRRAESWLSSLADERRLVHTNTPSVPGHRETNDTGLGATSKVD